MQQQVAWLISLVMIGVAGLCVSPPASGADEALTDAAPLEQITVVAHKDPRSIRDVAANVTALSRAALQDQLATSINDAFRYVPGVDYDGAGTRFGTEGVNIRGIGGNRVAMLIDGVPLSDQFDVGSFSNATRDFIDAGLVQSIEVLHGPSSAPGPCAASGRGVARPRREPSCQVVDGDW